MIARRALGRHPCGVLGESSVQRGAYTDKLRHEYLGSQSSKRFAFSIDTAPRRSCKACALSPIDGMSRGSSELNGSATEDSPDPT